MDDLLYRLRAAGLTVCDEAADALEAQTRIIEQWRLGSEIVAERVIAPLMDASETVKADDNGTD